jgi:hypothetical protein
MKKFSKILSIVALVGILATVQSCSKDSLNPTLEQEKELEGSIKTADDLFGLLVGTYNRMTLGGYYGRDFIVNREVRTDNVFANANSGRFTTPATFNYNPQNNLGVWSDGYRTIASANLVLGINKDDLEGDMKVIEHIQGQAMAIRALAHFDLLRNHGEQYVGGTQGVPIVTEFRGENLSPERNTVDEVKTAIYKDLEDAYAMMDASADFDGKVYISKIAVKAIESTVATYFKDYKRAHDAAKLVIDSGAYQIIDAADYVASFGLKNTKNSVFELAFLAADNLGINGLAYIFRGPNYGDIAVLPNVLNLYDAGDVRADIIVEDGDNTGYIRNMYKYPDDLGSDNVNVIRYEEIVLNYVEALVNGEGSADPVVEMNKLMAKRNAQAYTAVTMDDVLLERRRELIFEGQRFDDLVRMNLGLKKIDAEQNISGDIAPGDAKFAFPIPIVEMDANSNMKQNNGY